MTDSVQTPNKLSGTLAEAIAEVRWMLADGPDQTKRDPGYKLMLGKLHSALEADYPVAVELPTSMVPEELAPNIVRMQLRPSPTSWPVIQIGPGIATLNQDSRYKWVDFQRELSKFINALHAAYPAKMSPLQFVGLDLRFLNIVPVDPSLSLESQLKSLFNISVSIPDVPGASNDEAAFPQSFALAYAKLRSDLPGRLQLKINIGEQAGSPVFVFEFVAQSRGEHVRQSASEQLEWAEGAHSAVKAWLCSLRG